MKMEKEQPVIHPFGDYFAAKKAASEYFLEKCNHDCGTVMDEKRETKEGLYISFRSAQDETFRERYHVIINQNVKVKCAVKKDTKASPQQIAP